MANRKQISNKDRYSVFKKFDGCCAYCGSEINPYEFHVDHHTPLAKEGDDHIDNMLPACTSCNLRKSSLSIFEFKLKMAFDRYYGFSVPKTMRDAMMANGDSEVLGIEPSPFFYEIKQIENNYNPF